MKLCKKCNTEKYEFEFNIDRRMKDGLVFQCRDCQKRYYAGYITSEGKKESKIDANRKRLAVPEYREAERLRKKIQRNQPHAVAINSRKNKLWRESNKDYIKDYLIRRKYPLFSCAMKAEMYNNQNKSCAICNLPHDMDKLHIDHCHSSNKVRGLLCLQCNHGIGNFRDKIDYLHSAIKYISLSV